MSSLENIPVSSLLLNTSNPRLPSVDSQRGSIIEMIRDQQDKLYVLAADILENGLNPTETLIVVKDNDHYVVHEGNRRLVAIKLLETPDIIKDIDAKLHKKFQMLNKVYKTKPIEQVACTVFENIEDTNKWILLRHNGENQGKGTVQWNATQKLRYKNQFNKPSVALKFLDLYKHLNGGDVEKSERLINLKITNLTRLIQDPDFCRVIGIKVQDGNIYKCFPDSLILGPINKFMDDLLNPDFKVNVVYTKADRKIFADSIRDEFPLNEKEMLSQLNCTNDILGPTESLDQSTSGKHVDRSKITTKPTNSRKSLIPKDCKLTISAGRENNLYHELQRVTVSEFPNLAAIGLRAFIEFSFEYYLKKTKLKSKENTLKSKVFSAINHLRDKDLITEQEAQPVKAALQQQDSILSPNTLHAYVHNPCYHPDHDNLKITWDNFQIIISRIWNA